MSTPTYNALKNTSENMNVLLAAQQADGNTAAYPSGAEPFDVLIAKGVFNVNEKANQTVSDETFKITYTGNFIAPFQLFPVPAPVIFFDDVPSGTSKSATPGKAFGPLVYSEGSNGGVPPNYGLRSISFDDLTYLQSFNMQACALLTSFAFPQLTHIAAGFTIAQFPLCTSISLPKIYAPQGGIQIINCAILPSLSFPELTYNGLDLSINNNAGLTSLSAPKLKTVGRAINSGALPSLTTISYPSLEFIGSTWTQNANTSATSISAPNLKYIGAASGISINFASNSSCTDVTGWGTVGTLKQIAGNITMSGMALTQASVDHILALVASLDGTNGTVSWGTGLTLALNGGTNATPSAQGLIDKGIIVARGGTVTHN